MTSFCHLNPGDGCVCRSMFQISRNNITHFLDPEEFETSDVDNMLETEVEFRAFYYNFMEKVEDALTPELM